MDEFIGVGGNEDIFPHNDWLEDSDWESAFWYSKYNSMADIEIRRMSVQEAVERGILTVSCSPEILEDIKAHNALLEATRAAPMTEEEIQQIKFFADNINKICSGGCLAFSAPIRTPDPTEQEIAEWKEDYKKFCDMDIDGLYIKHGVKLLMSESDWDIGNVEEVHFDPRNRLQSDKYIDPLDLKARNLVYKKAQERLDEEMQQYGWGRNYEETSTWSSTPGPDDSDENFPQDDEHTMHQY